MGTARAGAALTLLPAIDIRGGRAVRLLHGDFERETAYDADPLEAAGRWVAEGARMLHIVDLDGAREGRPIQLDAVARVIAGVEVPVQVGGGLRDADAVEAALAAGADRAVLGTSAQREPDLIAALVEEHGADRIVAGVDARGGRVAVEGWEQSTATGVEELIGRLAAVGARRFVYTPVEVDGTLAGPGLDGLERIAATCAEADGSLIYSGGVGSIGDLRALAGLGLAGLEGVIVGRALYERRFAVGEAIDALEQAADG